MITWRYIGTILAAGLAVAILMTGSAWASNELDPAALEFVNRVEAAMPDWIAPLGGPGGAVALIRHGEVVWTAGYGLADVANETPITSETGFLACSLSKPVAAWGVMWLAEQGLISLDAPVETYLSRWHLPPSGYDSDGVTVRRLLSHTSGMASGSECFMAPHDYVAGMTIPGLVEVLSSSGPLCFVTREPGSEFVYSNFGYAILQLLVEEVTGEDFAVFMEREILLPLGMTNSSFDALATTGELVAWPHSGIPTRLPREVMSVTAPGFLCTSVADYARFVAASTTGPEGEPPGRGVLSPESVQAMLVPPVDVDTNSEHFDVALDYGLGVEVGRTQDCTITGHGGIVEGWMAGFRLLLEAGTGMVIFFNSAAAGPPFVGIVELWWDWAEEFLGCGP